VTISRYVPEVSDKLLSLFPHRFDYLWAEHTQPGASVQWKTENRHPLSDRHIQQGSYLYGVRFGAETSYALLDIDAGSMYHPRRDRFAVSRIMAALEPLGIVSYIACTSSYSGGLHLYLPISEPVATWRLAIAIAFQLESKGFTIGDGCLEIYPNTRNYDPDQVTLYKGHRLPLQQGCYLLNEDWNQLYTTAREFVARWEWCTSKNDIQHRVIEQTVRKSATNRFKLSGKASKFLSDLDTEIEAGWSSHGQTNFLLGRIALRSYIFGHLINGCEPLAGDRLVATIVHIATQLPGYTDWCRHRHEIWRRAEEWSRCVESSHYFHYRVKAKSEKPDSKGGSEVEQDPAAPDGSATNRWNAWQQQIARDGIRYAIADMLDRGALPAGARERFHLLVYHYGFGGGTVYRHRDLWHPEFIQPVDNPPTPPHTLEATADDCLEGASSQQAATSLLEPREGNASRREQYRQFLESIFHKTGGNTASDKPSSQLERDEGGGSG
jgi:hypothetical protein